ncbi:MAG TPA: hypothetical protein VF594_10235 [Rubricoccaceae bacterium]|jgi:hypothetical protein
MTRVRLPIAALAALLLVAACDSAPGLPDEGVRPSVTAFALSPAQDSLETTALTATVPLAIEATLAGEGRISVRVLVRYSGTPRVQNVDSLVADTLVTVEPGPVRIALPLALPRGATGDYAVSLSTSGVDGRTGGGASGVFRFRAASLGPPSVSGVTAGASVTRPQNGSAPFPISAIVSDPDGLANIAAVVLTDESGAVIVELFDEGRTGRSTADATAGDGRYTVSIGIPAAFEPGSYTLAVVALDRAGTQSAPAPFTFEVR